MRGARMNFTGFAAEKKIIRLLALEKEQNHVTDMEPHFRLELIAFFVRT
jgi:hypothetical protein